MRYLCAMMALLMMLGGCVLAEAKRPVYTISGGLALPSQPHRLNDSWNGGWHIGGGIGYPVTPYVTVGGAFSYSHLPFDAEAVIARSTLATYYPWVRVEGNSATIITGNCRLKVNFIAPTKNCWFSPYFFGGLGWYRLTLGEYTVRYKMISQESERTHIKPTSPSSQVGLDFGAGLEIYLSNRLNAFIEVADSGTLTGCPVWAECFPIRIGLIIH